MAPHVVERPAEASAESGPTGKFTPEALRVLRDILKTLRARRLRSVNDSSEAAHEH